MTGVVVVTVVLFSLLIGGADYALGYAVKPIYVQNASTTASAVPASTATPSATATARPRRAPRADGPATLR